MITYGIRTNADRVAVEFHAKADLLPGQMARAVSHGAQIIKGSIISFASGRPGPEIVTSAYVNSWGVKMRMAGMGASAEIGTNSEQGYRLEYGFHDTDSLGRHYAQPPFPHVEPGLAAALPTVMIVMEKVVLL
jgi:hypothetical protein